MVDHLSQRKRHIDVDSLDLAASWVDVFNIISEMLAARNPSNHEFTLLVAQYL